MGLKAADPKRPAFWLLALGGFAFASFLTQGLPYWDTDFAVNFRAIGGRGLGQLLLDWLSPIHQQWLPDYQSADGWGFLDRVAQFVVYRISFALAGYDAWPYLLFKNLCYAGLGALVYLWGRRAAGNDLAGRAGAAAAAIFFLVAPGPVAALVWTADFAPAAELAMLGLSYLLWSYVEQTPSHWHGLWPLDAEKRAWLVRWTVLAFAVYLAYKTKADLKLFSLIAGAYIALVRPRQWRLFALPLAAMLVLALPWGAELFGRLPPFVPGAQASPTGFFWRPASISTLSDFLWSAGPYDFGASLHTGSFSLAGLLGPFLLTALIGYAVWRFATSASPLRFDLATPQKRALLFALVWLAFILVASSALPVINDFFRVRYGILTLTPACIVLAWAFGDFARNGGALPRWAVAACCALLAIQVAVNFNRSISHRADLGHVMVAVDKVYGYVTSTAPNVELALWPHFLSYDYRHDARAIQRRDPVVGFDDLEKRHTPGSTLVVAWAAPAWAPPPNAALQPIAHFSGCRETTLFDRMFPCAADGGIVLLRYVGTQATRARASRVLERLAERYPTADLYLQLSYAYHQAGRFGNAIAAARQALRLRPRDATAYNNIAAGYEGLRDWDHAIAAARTALQLRPNFPLARNNLNWSLAQKALSARAR